MCLSHWKAETSELPVGQHLIPDLSDVSKEFFRVLDNRITFSLMIIQKFKVSGIDGKLRQCGDTP